MNIVALRNRETRMSTVQIGNLVLSQRRKDEVEQKKRLSRPQYIAQDKRAYFISYLL